MELLKRLISARQSVDWIDPTVDTIGHWNAATKELDNIIEELWNEHNSAN